MASRSLVPLGLIALGAIPLAAGVARLVSLARGAVTPDSARFFASPAPVVVHVVGSMAFVILGALQFVPRLRLHAWHRAAGRIATACGLAVGATGLWMTIFYPAVPNDGALLFVFRLVFGSAMIACIALGFAAIRRADVARHRAWMMRGYAIGLGAGTQAVLHLPFLAMHDMPGVLGRALLMGAGWTINVAVAEWSLRTG